MGINTRIILLCTGMIALVGCDGLSPVSQLDQQDKTPPFSKLTESEKKQAYSAYLENIKVAELIGVVRRKSNENESDLVDDIGRDLKGELTKCNYQWSNPSTGFTETVGGAGCPIEYKFETQFLESSDPNLAISNKKESYRVLSPLVNAYSSIVQYDLAGTSKVQSYPSKKRETLVEIEGRLVTLGGFFLSSSSSKADIVTGTLKISIKSVDSRSLGQGMEHVEIYRWNMGKIFEVKVVTKSNSQGFQRNIFVNNESYNP